MVAVEVTMVEAAGAVQGRNDIRTRGGVLVVVVVAAVFVGVVMVMVAIIIRTVVAVVLVAVVVVVVATAGVVMELRIIARSMMAIVTVSSFKAKSLL